MFEAWGLGLGRGFCLSPCSSDRLTASVYGFRFRSIPSAFSRLRPLHLRRWRPQLKSWSGFQVVDFVPHGDPITLISLASCVSYAHLMEPITFHKVPQLSVSFLSSASIFSAGFANLIHNLASNCPFLITCPDITFTLFLQAGQRSISHLAEAGHSTAFVALHLHALLLGMVLWSCGWFTPRIMASLRYLPYPVVAGFLAMIGAAVIMGALKPLGSLYQSLPDSVLSIDSGKAHVGCTTCKT